MQLTPGSAEEYRRRHEAPWPELLVAIRHAGVRTFTIYGAGEDLFVHSELDEPGAWERAWATDVHARWGAALAPLMAVGRDGSPRAGALQEIFHLAPQ